MSGVFKTIPIKTETGAARDEYVSLYEPSRKIYPRAVSGRFNTWRVWVVILTQLVYLGLPWLPWNGRQAVLFDLEHSRFFLFGMAIWPQDLMYLAALLMCSAFGLFLWTTIAGRLWCGYACPQTVYTEIMLWIEQWVEGDHKQRAGLDASPLSWHKAWKKTAKHGLITLFCLWTGFTLVGYFTPIHTLTAALPTLDYGPWEAFWILFYAGFTYLLAGVMREQVCKHMCPYARFQSAMFDEDTLIISYDAGRGEPRSARRKADGAANNGHCIDCGICVQVCPVGIDIRNGLQYECTGCAACVDACDNVMAKLQAPKGLIRYTTEAAMEQRYTESAIRTRLLRPRVLVYSGLLLLIVGSCVVSYLLRKPFKVDVIRDRASLVQEASNGWLENTYQLNITNTTEQEQRFVIDVTGLPGIKLSHHYPALIVKPAVSATITVRAQADPATATKGSHPIYFVVTSQNHEGIQVEEKSSFIGE